MIESASVPTKDQQISIRLEPDMAERAEALANSMSERPEYRHFRMTRATVLRMAMAEGLALLEQRYGVERAPKEKPTSRKR